MGEAATNINLDEQLLASFRVHEHFCKALLDAYVLVNREGRVIKCNQAFSQVAGLPSRQILKMDSFDDALALIVDNDPITINHVLDYKSPTRLDEISGRSRASEELILIVGIYPFYSSDGQNTPLGTFMLIRDVTAERGLQSKYHSTHKKSITDPLTGLYTRAYFEDYLENTMSMVTGLPPDSPQRVISLAMLDIDFFKKINDSFGHQAGDFVLKSVSESMLHLFRKTDLVCRYGGEEFLAIMPGTDLKGAVAAAQKSRQAIEQLTINFDGQRIPVTMSSGVSQILVGTESQEQAISRADNALYESKNNGRNQVSFHDGTTVWTAKKTMD